MKTSLEIMVCLFLDHVSVKISIAEIQSVAHLSTLRIFVAVELRIYDGGMHRNFRQLVLLKREHLFEQGNLKDEQCERQIFLPDNSEFVRIPKYPITIDFVW